jgi:processive 1,2-diacylglycerol beta-glucosyltransferase
LKVKAELERIDPPSRHRVHLLGFTADMHELMAAADIVVSKPGGLTTSEALASGTPMAIINPIPGQESRNSDFLLENGAGIKLNNLSTVPYKLTSLLGDVDRLAAMKATARRLGRPCAAYEVARHALRLAGNDLNRDAASSGTHLEPVEYELAH